MYRSSEVIHVRNQNYWVLKNYRFGKRLTEDSNLKFIFNEHISDPKTHFFELLDLYTIHTENLRVKRFTLGKFLIVLV